jgi:hypothetical protein
VVIGSIFKTENFNFMYIYLGDRLTDKNLIGAKCEAVRRADGKCIRSRMSTMLVKFENGTIHNILARRLRKIKIEFQKSEAVGEAD